MKNFSQNKTLLSSLPTVKPEGYKYAYLIEEESADIPPPTDKNKPQGSKYKQATGIPVYEFLYNPETIGISLPIKYESQDVPYTSVQPLNYVFGGNQTFTLSNLYLDTNRAYSLQPLLDKLISLREPSKTEGLIIRPKRLYFKWGSNKLGPLVLINMDASINQWVDGFPVRARINLVFSEVPPKNAIATGVTTPSTTPLTEQKNQLKKKLSDKQIEDGKNKISRYLSDNAYRLPKKAYDVYKDSKSSIRIDKDTGDVFIVSREGVRVLTIGNFNGDNFKPNSSFERTKFLGIF